MTTETLTPCQGNHCNKQCGSQHGRHVIDGRELCDGCASRTKASFVVRVPGVDGRMFGVRVIRPGDRYGLNDCLTVKPDEKPMAEFYDLKADVTKFGPRGQFVSRYNVDTLLGRDRYGRASGGVNLKGDVPVWTIDAREMDVVRTTLRVMFPDPFLPTDGDDELPFGKGRTSTVTIIRGRRHG